MAAEARDMRMLLRDMPTEMSDIRKLVCDMLKLVRDMDKLARDMLKEERDMEKLAGFRGEEEFVKVVRIGLPRAMPPVGVCCPVGAWGESVPTKIFDLNGK